MRGPGGSSMPWEQTRGVTKPLCMARGSPGHSQYPQIPGEHFFPIHRYPEHPDGEKEESRLGQRRGCSSPWKSPRYLPPGWGKDAGGGEGSIATHPGDVAPS